MLHSILRQSARSEGEYKQTNRVVVKVAAVFDTHFCALNNNDYLPTIGLLQALFDEANVLFHRDTCVDLAVVSVEGYCTPTTVNPLPFIFENLPDTRVANKSFPAYADPMNERFRAFFVANRMNVKRDVAYLLSAYRYTGEFSFGRSGYAGTCDDGNAYRAVNRPSANFLAHEIRHNLQCSYNTNKDSYAAVGGGDGSVFNATFISSQFYFTPECFANITAYVSTDTRAHCLSTDSRSCDDSCRAAPCINNKCVFPIQPPNGFTSCKAVNEKQ